MIIVLRALRNCITFTGVSTEENMGLGVQSSNKPSITERFNFELWSDNNFNLILPLKGVLEFMSFVRSTLGHCVDVTTKQSGCSNIPLKN